MEDNIKIFKDLCHLFCCPPKISHIVAKIAFFPPDPTYVFNRPTDSTEYHLELKNSAINLDYVRAFFVYTKKKTRIACAYLRRDPNKPAPYTMLYSHGNAVDIGQLVLSMQEFTVLHDVDVVFYDYSGYGVSTGKTLEQNLYSDSSAVFDYMTDFLKIPSSQIILYGQSIGTVPTVNLAVKHKCAAMVLHSALESGLKVLCPESKVYLCCDPFRNIDKINKVQCYGLIIHGKDDEIIPIKHGEDLYEKLNLKLQPLWVDERGHNDIEVSEEYQDRMKKFFEVDLDRIAKGEEPLFEDPSPVIQQPIWNIDRNIDMMSNQLRESNSEPKKINLIKQPITTEM